MNSKTVTLTAHCGLLAALLCLAPLAGAEAQESCHLTRKASIELTIDPTGRVTVPVVVAGKSLDMLVDTGGILSMVTPAAAAALSLPVQTIPNSTARMFGGLKVDTYITAPTFKLGGLTTQNVDLTIVPNFTAQSGSGVLAPDLLGAYDVDFDFANGRFSLFSADHCPGRVIYWTKGDYGIIPIEVDRVRHIRTTVELDGQPIEAIIDTGAERSVMSLEKAQATFDLDEPKGALKPESEYDIGSRYPFKTLSVGGIVVNDPDIVLLSDRVTNAFYYSHWSMQHGPTMIIGNNVLRHLHVYLSYKEEKIYVTAATAH